MAQERSATPEKQLLKIIEDPKSRETVQTVARKGKSLISPSGLKGRTSFFKGGVAGWFKQGGVKQLDIKALNRMLGLCNFVLIFYVVINISESMAGVTKLPDLNLGPNRQIKSEIVPVNSPLGKESEYLDTIGKRNIFDMVKEEEIDLEEEEQLIPTSTSAIVEATQHLKLVGISWSSDPDAMLEDTRALKTFFVKRGQLMGEVRVKEIYKDRITLSFQGEEMELR